MSTFYKAEFIITTTICTEQHHGHLWALSSGKKGLLPERQINSSRTVNSFGGFPILKELWRNVGNSVRTG